MAARGVQVVKFGGTSVANADCVLRAMRTVENLPGQVVVVVSAMGGLTNRLLEAARLASEGDLEPAKATATEFLRRHEELIDTLFSGSNSSGQAHCTEAHHLRGRVHESVEEFEGICSSLAVLKERTTRILDVVVARGERLLAEIFAMALNRALEMASNPKGPNHRATFVDAAKLLHVELGGEFVSLNKQKSIDAVNQDLKPVLNRGSVVVVPGFLGSGPEGQVVTLGRGGSDFSATLLADLLEANQVTLYKEVDGLLTADPRCVPEARVISQLHYREATELAFYGAQVLHPRTIMPLMEKKIPLFIKNSFQPEFEGTRISGKEQESDYPVKALTAISKQAMITVQGNGMMGTPGIAGRTFSALAGAKLSTSFISQASSESSICFVVPQQEADQALMLLRETFATEIERNLIEDVVCSRDLAIAAVVGQGMQGHHGVAARTMMAISEAGANIVAIAQGSSELNISVAVKESDKELVLRSLHREYRLHEMAKRPEQRGHHSMIAVHGFGQIGQTLLAQIESQKQFFQSALQLELHTSALVDSSGALCSKSGFSDVEIEELVAAKKDGKRLTQMSGIGESCDVSKLTGQISTSAAKNIYVDCSASESWPQLMSAVKDGCHVVLANKRPLAVKQADYDALFAECRNQGVAIRFEATVGAGLPVLDTIEKLNSAGDEIHNIEGCLSGTLGYLMSAIGAGQPFSEAVKEAFENGFTEPDPREDLSGIDVARKALILARSLGMKLDFTDIPVESLFPNSANEFKGAGGTEEYTPARFIENLKSTDESIFARVQEAAKEGQVLRYVATIDKVKNSVNVGLKAVPADGPMGGLKGTDNQVTIHSRRYDSNPLVVTGPGAGAEVTASGVLSDIISISQKASTKLGRSVSFEKKKAV